MPQTPLAGIRATNIGIPPFSEKFHVGTWLISRCLARQPATQGLCALSWRRIFSSCEFLGRAMPRLARPESFPVTHIHSIYSFLRDQAIQFQDRSVALPFFG